MPTPPQKKQTPLGVESEAPVYVDAYLYASVDVNPENLEDDMQRAPADLAYWNERHALAHRQHLEAKLNLEREEARLTLEYREKMTAAWMAGLELDEKGKKKAGTPREPAEAQIRAAVLGDDAYNEARLAEIAAEVERTRIRGIVSAVDAKKDMIQSINATRRLEMSDPLLRASRSARSD